MTDISVNRNITIRCYKFNMKKKTYFIDGKVELKKKPITEKLKENPIVNRN